MVKIIHMADTHLGYRARRGTINKWAILNYSKPYEQEIYDTFLKVIDDVSIIEDLDFLVHCGDMFHMPSQFSSYPPQEPARRVLKQGLDLFFKNTNNKVPFIYIEGNHGVFRGFEYTPVESLISYEKYPNLYYFKERDLLNALKNNEPLIQEFKGKKVRFFLFPYFEFKGFEVYKDAYDKWINLQKPNKNDGFIDIAVAHGSEADDTLHKKIKQDDFSYDYIALGHEHALKKKSRTRYYTGCLLPMNFKERIENQGYLIVDINDNSKELTIEEVFTDDMLKRTFEIIPIEVSPQDTLEDLRNKINNELKKFESEEGFEPKTSARLKINFKGEMTYEKIWLINDLMIRIRRDRFSQPEKNNIFQLIWKTSDISENIENDISPGIIEDYILEKPDEEFKDFVNEKLSAQKSQFDVDKLTKFGMEAIRNALKIMDKEKEV